VDPTLYRSTPSTEVPKCLDTKNILIATGSEVMPPVPVDNAKGKIVCSTGARDLKVPSKMAVIGGGAISLKWAPSGVDCADVTVIEFMDRSLPPWTLKL
jgi:dihydrolipoamide dehydrogenase